MSFLLRLWSLIMSLIMLFSGPSVPVAFENSVKEALAVPENASSLEKTEIYASNAKNGVQAIYADTDRSAYTMKNENMCLTHTLSDRIKSATLTDTEGNPYIKDSFFSFYTDKSGIKHYFEKSAQTGRVNTIRLGIYYYDCHIRDLASGSFKIDKNFHVYNDRMYLQYLLFTSKKGQSVKELGAEFNIAKSTVDSLLIKDKNGEHTDISGIDCESVEYLGFDVAGTGVLGFVVPSDGSVSKVTVKAKGGNYVVTVYSSYVPGTKLNDNNGEGGFDLDYATLGCRIYTDKNHSFDSFKNEAELERNPLDSISVTGDGYDIHYDALRGAYTFTTNGPYGFQHSYDNPYERFLSNVTVKGDSSDRTLYFRSTGEAGTLECAALLNDKGELMAEGVEVCKNFKGDGGESFYSPRDFSYGDCIFPICVNSGDTVNFTLINLYQNWGQYPLKQISSIEFHVSYYHLSTGTTESNCIAPYFVFGKDGWTLPDFRNHSGVIWETQPQFNSVGILKFAKRTDKKNDVYSELSGTRIDSTGPVYSDITNSYLADDGAYTCTLRHVEMPQTDENRTYYNMKITFNEDVEYENFARDFDLFYFDGRYVKFNSACFLSADGKDEYIPVNTAKQPAYHTLSKDMPYFGFSDITEDTVSWLDSHFGSNFGLIVRDYSIISGGKKQDIALAFRDSSDSSATIGALTLDKEKIAFKKGDSIELDMILLPWGKGTEANASAVKAVRKDSAENRLSLTASTGEAVNDLIIPTVKAQNNKAVFTVTGGKNETAVKITGVTKHTAPKVSTVTENGTQEYKLSSDCGYDGYEIALESDGTYTYSFIYMSDGSPATFSVEF